MRTTYLLPFQFCNIVLHTAFIHPSQYVCIKCFFIEQCLLCLLLYEYAKHYYQWC